MKLFLIVIILTVFLFSISPPVPSSNAVTLSGRTSFLPTLTLDPLTLKHQTLTSPNAQTDGWFGTSVSMSGKLVASGAPEETADGYSEAGHAYVFNANTGKLIETLTSPNAQQGGLFGGSVYLSGKLVSVGAPFETANGYSNAGRAYVFNANTGKLIQTLTSPHAQTLGLFGTSVSMSGKLVTVGAPFELSHGYGYAGNAYAFNATSGKLIQTLTNPNAQYDGNFGTSVSMSGTLVAVGAPYVTADGYSEAGQAYVFYNV